MFGFGFWEIMIIAVLALLVLGPERVPKVAREAGKIMGQARRYMNELRYSIDSATSEDEPQEHSRRELHEAAKRQNQGEFSGTESGTPGGWRGAQGVGEVAGDQPESTQDDSEELVMEKSSDHDGAGSRSNHADGGEGDV